MNNTLLHILQSELSTAGKHDIESLNEDFRKRYAALHFACSQAKVEQHTWHAIRVFLHDFLGVENRFFVQLGKKWYPIACIMTKEFNTPMLNFDDIAILQLTNKTTVIVYPDNSAIFSRAVRQDRIIMSVFIPNIFNEQESTSLLYQASESNAYDVLSDIKKKISNFRKEVKVG